MVKYRRVCRPSGNPVAVRVAWPPRVIQMIMYQISHGPMLLKRPVNPMEILVSNAVCRSQSWLGRYGIHDFDHSIILTQIKPWVHACLWVKDVTHLICSYLCFHDGKALCRDLFQHAPIPMPSTSCRESDSTETIVDGYRHVGYSAPLSRFIFVNVCHSTRRSAVFVS
jgi:hypothetical protein